MDKSSRIYVAGHTGLVGSAIKNCLEKKGYHNLILRTQEQLDLVDQKSVNDFFRDQKPDYVFLAAAMVGGIMANNTFRADFIYHNLMIQSNIIYASWKNNVIKLLFLGSTCIYPKKAPQPLKEEYLLTSELEYTNEPYAIAKIAGLKMCESFNIQYKTNFIAVMPTNLYGPGDNFNLDKSHVLPALLRKIHLGKCLESGNWEGIRKDLNKNPIENINGYSDANSILDILKKYGIQAKRKHHIGDNSGESGSNTEVDNVTVSVWGTGAPLREFMYSLDMAEACVYLMENVDVKNIIDLNMSVLNSDSYPPHFLNIGTGEEISIRDLASKLKKLIGFKGEIIFDSTKPDGTKRKATDIYRLKSLGYEHKFDLNSGLEKLYSEYGG